MKMEQHLPVSFEYQEKLDLDARYPFPGVGMASRQGWEGYGRAIGLCPQEVDFVAARAASLGDGREQPASLGAEPDDR
jgi:hypothetical protein